MTDLERAAAHVNAVQISPLRWAHRDDGTRTWWVVTSKQLRLLGEMLRKHTDAECPEGDVYSEWCSRTSAKEMPRDWSPE